MSSHTECSNIIREYMKNVDEIRRNNRLFMNLDGLVVYKDYINIMMRGCDVLDVPHQYRVRMYPCETLFRYRELFENNRDNFPKQQQENALRHLDNIMKFQKCIR